MNELKIGCHLSFAEGYEAMGEAAVSIDANAFQYFSRNPRGGSVKAFDETDCARLCATAKARAFAPFLVHAPYTYNPCAAKPDLREFATNAMEEDLQRQNLVDYDCFYNFHPGSHVGQGADTGVLLCAQMLGRIDPRRFKTTVLIETMSGKGSEIGANFGEIARIMELSGCADVLGVCLDTCHVYSAGYDIVNNLDGVLEEFDNIIGLSKLKAIHLNDSMTPFSSHKDRHEVIGKGSIGLDAIVRIINHPILKKLPFFLETPNDISGYAAEISLLRGLYNG